MSEKVKIQIYRKSNFTAMLWKVRIEINGNQVGTVGNGKNTEIMVGEGKHKLTIFMQDLWKKVGLKEEEFEVTSKTKDYDYIWDYHYLMNNSTLTRRK